MDLYVLNSADRNKALFDLVSMAVNSQFEGKVTFTFDNEKSDANYKKVNVAFSTEIPLGTIDSDPGLSLIRDLTGSTKKYLYEVANTTASIDRNDVEQSINLGTPNQKGSLALNLSTNPRGDSPKDPNDALSVSAHNAFDGKPKNGFDGHVIVSPNAGDATTSSKKGASNVNRAWFTFHELKEVYNRTDKGMNFNDAHKGAEESGKNHHFTPQGWDQKPVNPYGNVKIKRGK